MRKGLLKGLLRRVQGDAPRKELLEVPARRMRSLQRLRGFRDRLRSRRQPHDVVMPVPVAPKPVTRWKAFAYKVLPSFGMCYLAAMAYLGIHGWYTDDGGELFAAYVMLAGWFVLEVIRFMVVGVLLEAFSVLLAIIMFEIVVGLLTLVLSPFFDD